MSDEEKLKQNENIRSLLILVAALAAIWLWFSWFYGWPPFSSQGITTQEDTMQQIPQSVLDSFTAPADSLGNDIPQSVLDSSTAPAKPSSVPDLYTL